MHAPEPRGPFVRHWRRLRVRWRAYRTPAGENHVSPPPLLPGVSPEQQQRAIAHVCRAFGADAAGDLRSTFMQKSVGLPLRAPDGAPSWLKISRTDSFLRGLTAAKERDARSFPGVPMPAILHEMEWRADGIPWHAFVFSLAPSPAVQPMPWMRDPPALDETWLTQLKSAVAAVSALPLKEWVIHPGIIARTIGQRFGRKAPHVVDDWRMAHGDLTWANVTAPELVLLDWERWGVYPRGFDAATLLSATMLHPDLYRRIERAFLDDLDTPSGVVARLYLLGRLLNRIEAGFNDPHAHRPAEAEAKRLLRM